MREILNISTATETSALDERNFGQRLELTGKENYQLVYEADREDPGQTDFGVENTLHVRERVGNFVADTEDRIKGGTTIILITHADVGVVLQTVFEGLPPNAHRKLPKLKNAEIRQL